MAKLRRDQVMIAREMVARDVSIRTVAGQLGVDEEYFQFVLEPKDDLFVLAQHGTKSMNVPGTHGVSPTR